MSVKIGILKERAPSEKRVAASPDTIRKLIALGCAVTIESGAGDGAHFPDPELEKAGAKIAKSGADIVKSSDIILSVQGIPSVQIETLKKDCCVIGMLAPHKNSDDIKAYADSGAQAFSMELIPRITRAQSMDVLSSQANLAGYKAVLDAAAEFERAFPMMMTAAGTVSPAKVFVMGAGVAGLQAIATARRLGGIVSATDVRPAAKEQVQSLGASFVAVEDDEFKQAETAGGYAKEMSDEYRKKQAALIEEHIAKQDIVITTALIPGRTAPVLVSDSMVKSMKPGSVIVDLAVESGGNVAGSKPGNVVEKNGVKIVGHMNVPSRLSRDASALYAKNLLSFVSLLIDQESGKITVNTEDDIIKATLLTQNGKIVHPVFSGPQAAAARPKEKKSATAKKTTGAKKKSSATSADKSDDPKEKGESSS